MNHNKLERLVSAYVDHELDERGMNSIRAHIEGCVSCKKQLEELQLIRVRIREAATASLPDNFVFSVRGAIRREEQESVVWLGPERFARKLVVMLSILVFGIIAYSSMTEPQPSMGVSQYFSRSRRSN